MDPFLKMDIFFVVATAVTLLLGLFFVLVAWKLWKILGHVEQIAEIAGKEAENLREDAAYVRGRLLGALDAIFAFIPRRRRHKASEETK
ncbi:hypothetical protein HY968_04410 [Candidatus Kaiserbacteria bacterium]|nr:hypothetical protein [Candidatus Kaiserbacteria bacterium]